MISLEIEYSFLDLDLCTFVILYLPISMCLLYKHGEYA